MQHSLRPEKNQASSAITVSDELAFFVAANDRDVLGQINRLMAHYGYVGITDTAGRVHYLIDGRRGTPYASRRILEATGRILCDRLEARQPVQQLVLRFVDDILRENGIRPELKGYRYLRVILLIIGLDDTRIRPISKKLYPAVAEHFHVRTSQIERDIRYALRETALHRNGLTPAASICRLQHDLARAVEREEQTFLQDNRPAGPADNGKPLSLKQTEGFSDYDRDPGPGSP